MSCTHRLSLILAAFALSWCLPATSHAQGLLWNLPADGAIAEFAGTYKNKQERPLNNAGPLELEWESRLTIQSVGEETAEFEGLPTPCRWIEFKLVTGKPPTKGVEADAAIDPGPHGTRIYKVLVPISRIKGQLKDDDKLPVTFVPIVKGFRKIGQQPAQVLKEKVLSFYPVLGLFANYLDLKEEGEPADVNLPNVGAIKAQLWKGSMKLQNQTSKSENVGEIWRADEVPFGWVQYKVKLTRLEKDITAPPTAFAPAAEIEVEMKLTKKETSGAKSELGDVTEENAAPAAEEKEEKAQKPEAETPAAEKPATEKAEETEKPETEKPAAEKTEETEKTEN